MLFIEQVVGHGLARGERPVVARGLFGNRGAQGIVKRERLRVGGFLRGPGLPWLRRIWLRRRGRSISRGFRGGRMPGDGRCPGSCRGGRLAFCRRCGRGRPGI